MLNTYMYIGTQRQSTPKREIHVLEVEHTKNNKIHCKIFVHGLKKSARQILYSSNRYKEIYQKEQRNHKLVEGIPQFRWSSCFP